MDNDFIKITTFVQARFQIIKREIICFKLKDSMGYFMSNGGNKVKMIIQPNHGSATELYGNFNLLKNLFKEIDLDMYVCKGGKLISKKNNILDRFADYIRRQ